MATLASIIASIACAPVHAEEANFRTLWLVQPNDPPPTRKTIAKGQPVLKQRLLPPSLATLSEDVIDPADGSTLLKAGEQLFGVLASSGGPIFCQPGRKDASALVSALTGGQSYNRQLCFVDFDRDGRLDRFFTIGNAIKGLPNFVSKLPDTRNSALLQGGAYADTPPAEMKLNYFVAVIFAGKGNFIIKGKPIFQIDFGTETSQGHLTERIVGEVPDQPRDMHILGSSFRVLAVRSDGIDVEIQQQIPVQPFGVAQQITWR